MKKIILSMLLLFAFLGNAQTYIQLKQIQPAGSTGSVIVTGASGVAMYSPTVTVNFRGRITQTNLGHSTLFGLAAGSLDAISTGSNSAFGENALKLNVSGTSNSAFGFNALTTSSAAANSAFGFGAMKANTTGSLCVAIGHSSGLANTTGNGGIFLGYFAGAYMTTYHNRLFVNSIDRTNISGDTTKSIIYGYQHATNTSQRLYVNGKLYVLSDAAVAGNVAVTGTSAFTGNSTFAGNIGVTGTSAFTGNSTFAGDVAITGNSTLTGSVVASNLLWGTYTPTLTNTTNVAASTASVTNYYRVGNMVTVFGKVSIDVTTAAGTATELQMTLPIASDMTVESDLGGTAATQVAATLAIRIKGDATSNLASFVFAAGSASNDAYAFQFSYQVK